MNIAALDLSITHDQRIVFNVHSGTTHKRFDGPSLVAVHQLWQEMRQPRGIWATGRTNAVRRLVDHMQPHGFADWWQQWTAAARDDAVLCVHSADSDLSTLPWLEILLPAGLPVGRVWVVHVCRMSGSQPPDVARPARMLLAGWPSLTGHMMLGIVREMRELADKLNPSEFNIRVLAQPTLSQLLDACADPGQVLHLVPPSLMVTGKGEVALPVSVDRSEKTGKKGASSPAPADFDILPMSKLTEVLKHRAELAMVMLNACNSGLDGCRQIATALNVAAIGWPFLVSDDTAADFASFFYQRLIEGWTPVQAVREFIATLGGIGPQVATPAIWLPSPEWTAWRPLPGVERKGVEPETRAAQKARASQPERAVTGRKQAKYSDRLAGGATPRHVEVAPPQPQPPSPTAAASPGIGAAAAVRNGLRLEFRPRVSINPALLVNGLAPIEHISVEAPGDQEVHLRIECDTGAGGSTFRQTLHLKKGVVPVKSADIHFPALHELIAHHAGRRRVSFTATLTSLDGREILSETSTALWMGSKEWLDQEDTWAFIPAFVNPHDEGVLKVFQHAKKVLQTLGDPTDTFAGYDEDRQDYVSTQMKAIFQTLRDDTIGLNYIARAGSPLYDPVSKRVCGQVVRTHAEVVERKFGTCQDLALLIAACAEYVGIHPLIVLIPGHTFVAYWLSSSAHLNYWKQREGRLPTARFGERWTITDARDLQRLVGHSQVKFLEATFVCERNKTFNDACNELEKQFAKEKRDDLDAAIDIYAARREVQPL